LIRVVFATSLAVALSGCLETLVQVRDAVLNPDPEVEMTVPRVNRKAIEDADLAAVLMLSPTIGIGTVGIAVQMRDGRIIYNSNENRSVTLEGGLIYSTLGLGTNLQAVTSQNNDPLITEARAGQWPAKVTRTYHFSGRGTAFDKIVTTCTNQTSTRADVEIASATRDVVAVVETCQADAGIGFNNIHYLDAGTGRLWRSIQWTGPVQGNIQIDVIEQFDPDA